jgi:hypothetical protein
VAPRTASYQNFPKLKEFFTMISTNKDRQGKEFVSTAEAKAYPIYATQVEDNACALAPPAKRSHTPALPRETRISSHVSTRKQWHPERPQFEWVVEDNINHDAPTIEAMQWVGRFLASQVRQKYDRI